MTEYEYALGHCTHITPLYSLANPGFTTDYNGWHVKTFKNINIPLIYYLDRYVFCRDRLVYIALSAYLLKKNPDPIELIFEPDVFELICKLVNRCEEFEDTKTKDGFYERRTGQSMVRYLASEQDLLKELMNDL